MTHLGRPGAIRAAVADFVAGRPISRRNAVRGAGCSPPPPLRAEPGRQLARGVIDMDIGASRIPSIVSRRMKDDLKNRVAR